MQKKLVKILLSFVGVILLLTVISRIGASFVVPIVSVTHTKSMKISHSVESEGEVAPGYTIPVFLDEGLFIEEISVLEGQKVSKGEKLLKLNKEKTKKQLKELQYEYDQLELQRRAAASEKKTNKDRYAQGLKNSKKQLQLALDTTRQEVGQAKDDMERAEKAYKMALKNSKKKSGESKEPQNSDNGQESEKDGEDTDEAVKERVSENVEENLKELEREKKEAKKAYYEALSRREEQVVTAQSALDEASVPFPADTSVEQLDIQKQIVNDKIKQMKKYEKDNYYIFSQAEGIVNNVMVSVGELSPATASFIVANTQEDFKVVVYENMEKGKYITKGTEAEIKGMGEDGEYTTYRGKVFSVKKAERDEGQCLEIIIYLPAETFHLSSFVELTFENYSDDYDYCIPVSALNQDDKGDFIYTTETKSTVLGDELTARKIYVDILDKNEEYAAVSSGTITDNMDIIITADREIEEGNRVRKE